MTYASTITFRLAGICFLASFAGCGDSGDGGTDGEGAGGGASRPPAQQAIYLRGKEERVPGTKIRNSATLSMTGANLLTRSGDDSVPGKVTMLQRDVWWVDMLSANERRFSLEEGTYANESEIGGKPKKQSFDSTLAGREFKIARADASSPWLLDLEGEQLTDLQERDLRQLSDLWIEDSHGLYPAEPVEIGQKWEADPKAFGAIFSPRLKVERGEVTCRLDEITVLRGERCGAVSVKIDVAGTFTTPAGTGMDVEIALSGMIMRSLYKNFDMRTELKGSMRMQMDFPDEDREITIDGVAEFLRLAEIVSSPEK